MPALTLLRADKHKAVRDAALDALTAFRSVLGEPQVYACVV